MGARVGVAGASGYAGGELLRLLAGHPDLEITALSAAGSAGRTVAEVHPHLAGVGGLSERVLAAYPEDGLTARSARTQVGDALGDCDLVFAALPPSRSAALAVTLAEQVKMVDLGPDFRLTDAQSWSRHYDGEYAGRWVTGLPELPGARQQIQRASRVATPGCYATAAILALVPLVGAGLTDPGDVVVVAASGTSGAGRTPRPDLLASEVMGSLSAYAVGGVHRHIPEIEQALVEALPARTSRVRVSFTPLLTPTPRGILATCTAPLTDSDLGTAALRAVLGAAYSAEPFVTLLPEGSWPATASVAGSNGVHLQAAVDSRAGRAVVVAAIDNLGKGAAGQAVQVANLMLGLAESSGLTTAGVAP